jgi:hypothetical protein
MCHPFAEASIIHLLKHAGDSVAPFPMAPATSNAVFMSSREAGHRWVAAILLASQLWIKEAEDRPNSSGVPAANWAIFAGCPMNFNLSLTIAELHPSTALTNNTPRIWNA